MDDQFRKRITDDLETSDFAAEMRAMRTILRCSQRSFRTKARTEVSEASEMAMTFCYQSPHYQRLSYGIDVIRADHIGHYLERCEKRQQAVVEKLFSLAEREGDAITAPDGRAYRERPLVSAGR